MNASTVDNPTNAELQIVNGASMGFTGATGVCLVLVYLAAVIKYLERRRSRVSWTGECIMLSVGTLLFTAFAIAGISMFSFGSDGNSDKYSTSLVASEVTYILALAVLKISLLLFYQRTLFHQAQYWKLSVGLACLFSIYTFIEMILFSVQCRPVVSGPDFQVGKCINAEAFEIALGAFDFLTNTTILLLPTRMVWQMRSEACWTTRICLGLAFLYGFIACILSLIHAIAPATAVASWTLLYPLTGILALTLTIIASAVASLPSLILSRGAPLVSPTETHPHLIDGRNSRASILTWVPTFRGRSHSAMGHQHEHERNYSSSTFPSVTVVDENTNTAAEKIIGSDGGNQIESEHTSGGRSMSLSSYQRLGSLTGGIKTPSFLQNMASRNKSASPPSVLELQGSSNGIHVQTDVEMSFEKRKKRKSGASSKGGNSSNTPTRPKIPTRSWSKGWN